MDTEIPREIRIGNQTFKTEELTQAIMELLQEKGPDTAEKIEKLASSIGTANLPNMNSQEAVNLLTNAGINPEDLIKKIRRKKAEQKQSTKTPKVGANEICPCGSGIKYKKCCRKLN